MEIQTQFAHVHPHIPLEQFSRRIMENAALSGILEILQILATLTFVYAYRKHNYLEHRVIKYTSLTLWRIVSTSTWAWWKCSQTWIWTVAVHLLTFLFSPRRVWSSVSMVRLPWSSSLSNWSPMAELKVAKVVSMWADVGRSAVPQQPDTLLEIIW